MGKKPTYEELEQRIRGLEKKAVMYRRMEERQRLLSSAVEQTSEGVAVSDLEGNLFYANRALADMHGYTQMELSGENLSIFHNSEQIPSVEEANRRLRETGEFSGEIWHVRRSGAVFPTLMNNLLLRDDMGRPIGIIATIRDISRRRQAEDAHRESEGKYRVLFETAKDAVFVSDETGRFVDVNQAACELLGYSREELLKLGNRDIDADPRGYEAFLDVRDGVVEKATFEVDQKRKDGTLVSAEIAGSFFKSKGRRLALAIVRDITRRKQAEEALRESERFNHSLLNSSPNPIIVINADSSIRYVNPALEKLTGFFSEEVIGTRAPYPWWPEETMEKTLADFDKAMDRGVQKLEVLFQKKNGERFWVEITSSSPSRDDKFKYYLANWVDITKRKRAEEELKKSEEKLWSILNGMTDFCYVVSEDFRVEFMNKAMIDKFGDQTGDICYKAFFNRESPCPWSRLEDIRQGKTTRLEKYLPKLEGTFEIIDSPLRNKDGTISKLGIWRDTSERKRAEEALRETRDYLENLINHANAPIIVWDPEFRITRFNNAFERLSGYTAGEVMGRELHMFFSEESREKTLNRIMRTLGGEYWKSVEIPILRKDGDIRLALWNSANIHAKDGKTLLATIAQGIDITERMRAQKEKRELEAQLQQAQKMEALGTMAGGISHDFNNILSAIIGFTEIALYEVPKGTSLESNLLDVFEAGKRAKDLVRQILAFSRLGRQELKPVRIKDIARETLPLIETSLPSGVEIRADIQSESTVLADSTQVYQVIMNLCTNAGHAMRKKGGVLELKLADVTLDSGFASGHPGLKPGSYVELTVSDTGHGIPPNVLDRIFDPFFTTKEKGGGTGMGLSVVHGIVKSHGGEITVRSESGKGSTFSVFFPTTRKEAVAETDAAEPLPTGSERILFVDDEPPLANMGRQMLEQLGYEVVAATGSIEALELFRAGPDRFDLVITDMAMPKMTGAELAGKLMEIRADIPVILCTGYSETILEKKAKEMGIGAFTMKPVMKRDLALTVRKVLDGV